LSELSWKPRFSSIFEGLIEIMDKLVWFLRILLKKIRPDSMYGHTFVTF
jgi:hypothetical protein